MGLMKTVSLDGAPRACAEDTEKQGALFKTVSASECQKSVAPPRENLVPRADSALRQNIAEKGANAYYFAHGRDFVVPENAKVVTGPGLITGGAPTLISREENAPSSEGDTAGSPGGRKGPTQWVKDFSWADSGVEKAKVYVELPKDGVLTREDQVTVDFRSNGLECVVTPVEDGMTIYRCKIEPLHADVEPDECSFRVSVAKARVTITLKKKRNAAWDELQKKGKGC